MKIKFGIIGCGRISINHIDAIHHAPSAQLAAVCDIDEEKAKKAAQENNLSAYYTDIDTMLENEQLDVCCILTPSGMHAQHTVKVANHGVHVLCEKPLDVTKEKMQMMIDACKANGVKLGCIFQRRTCNMAIKTKETIENGHLGIVTIGSTYLKYYRDQAYYDSGDWRGTWELDGGGALMNQCVHGIDLLRWMMGGIKSVQAHCERLVWNTEAEDTAVAIFRFQNGAIGVMEGTTSSYPGLDTIFSINGSEGSISFGDRGFYHWLLKDNSIEEPSEKGNLGGLNCAYNTDNYGHTYQIEDVARAILEDREPMICGEDAKKSVEVILAIYESARTGKEIFLD